jgi:hypothetical protein
LGNRILQEAAFEEGLALPGGFSNYELAAPLAVCTARFPPSLLLATNAVLQPGV